MDPEASTCPNDGALGTYSETSSECTLSFRVLHRIDIGRHLVGSHCVSQVAGDPPLSFHVYCRHDGVVVCLILFV